MTPFFFVPLTRWPLAPGEEPVDGPAGRKLWIVAADAPAGRFNEAEINRRLSDVDRVSRVAVGHERVVAAFIQADTAEDRLMLDALGVWITRTINAPVGA